ncbi:hypothetical protein FF2_033631 [Malus domestica]
MLDPNTNPHEHPFLFNNRADDDEIKSDTTTNYDSWHSVNYASRAPQKTTKKYGNHSMGGRINVDNTTAAGDESDSPPLRKTTSRVKNYRSLSPASKKQAIARGQRELMEMVKNMPESCYELSLKDLVEHKYRPMGGEEEEDRNQYRGQEEEYDDRSTENLVRRGNGNGNENEMKKNGERKKLVMRSGSIDSGGFLLKMVLPISLGGKKKNNKSVKEKGECLVVDANSNNMSAKVSPKPQGLDGSVKVVGGDNEWWKMKRFSVSERSESGVSSINSGSRKSSGSGSSSSCSSRSSSRRKSSGCWSFILLKKNKRRD